MKLLCFSVNGESRLGLKLSAGVLDLTAAGYCRDLTATIRDFEVAAPEIEALGKKEGLPLLDEKSLNYLPPATAASKILCVGLNYKEDYIVEYPSYPKLFSKFNNVLSAHNGTVKFSPNAHKYDYEAELVIVIGKGGMDIPKEKAADYIFGYTCGNDLSARDVQKKEFFAMTIAKSLPGFAPLGPWIVTTDELGDARGLAISCRRGDRLVQDSNTDKMVFDAYTVVSFASQYINFEPGDLIYTGTPGGIITRKPPEQQDWLKAGEEVTISIEKIGDLTTRFV